MSDRIDELVAAIDANTLLQWDGKDVALVAAHELATIARENAAEADKWRKVAEEMRDLESAALPLWNHIGCAGCGNWPQAECAAQYKRFVDALYKAARRHNTAVEQEEAE